MKKILFPILFISVTLCAQNIDVLSIVDSVNDLSPVLNEERSRFQLSADSETFDLENRINQKVVARDKGSGKTDISIETGKYSQPVILSATERTGYLSETRMVHPKTGRVRAYTALIKKEADPVHAVELLVNKLIVRKEMGIPIVSDEMILDLKAGDCTEHAILAIGILRAAGIPSRAVTGMVLAPRFGGKNNIFVFHMWAEAYWKGEWVLVDATFSGAGKHNRYIALSGHSLKTEAPLEYLELFSTMKGLKVRYIK